MCARVRLGCVSLCIVPPDTVPVPWSLFFFLPFFPRLRPPWCPCTFLLSVCVFFFVCEVRHWPARVERLGDCSSAVLPSSAFSFPSLPCRAPYPPATAPRPSSETTNSPSSVRAARRRRGVSRARFCGSVKAGQLSPAVRRCVNCCRPLAPHCTRLVCRTRLRPHCACASASASAAADAALRSRRALGRGTQAGRSIHPFIQLTTTDPKDTGDWRFATHEDCKDPRRPIFQGQKEAPTPSPRQRRLAQHL